MSFQPPIRPTKPISPNNEPKGFIDALAEKDDVLLYFTAFLGVVMPGVVYFVYHKVHDIYMRYAERKEAERLKEEREKAVIAIFYASNQEKEGPAEMRANELRTMMGDEAPKIYNMESMNGSDFSSFKGIGIFIVETALGGAIPERCEWFFEWLEDVAADIKQKKKTCVDQIRFCVMGLASSQECSEPQFNKAAKTLDKRLRIVGAKDLMSVESVDREMPSDLANTRFQKWVLDVMDTIEGNIANEGSESEVFTDESESDLSDADEIVDQMRADRKKTK